jgi:hypothetical protein
MTELRFTRYLYEVDEVKLALIMSILNNKPEAEFWAYELYHSGYSNELTLLFWEIYYDFYASLNPAFEKYLLTKLKNCLENEKVVAMIVNNFTIRPHNTDMFLLRTVKTPLSSNRQELQFTTPPDYYSIAAAVLHEPYDEDKLNKTLEHFANLGMNLNQPKIVAELKKQTEIIRPNILLMTLILRYYSKLNKLKMGKNLYIQIDMTEIEEYRTILLKQPRKILKSACIHSIDEHGYLSLFQLKRDDTDIVAAYRNDWLYTASFSPLWNSRIKQHNGTLNVETKEVVFETDDDTEEFYSQFGLEPDEQALEVQNKSIAPIRSIDTINWYSFYEGHGIKNGVVRMTREQSVRLNKLQYLTMQKATAL